MPPFRPTASPVNLIAVVLAAAMLAGCGGSSSGGAPSPSASTSVSVGPNTQVGQASTLREPMSKTQATAAESKLRSLPGVVAVQYDAGTHELLVDIAPTITMKQRQRVVLAIANATK